MIVKDSIRVKTDGHGTIRLTIMRDGHSISTTICYSFDDKEKPIIEVPVEAPVNSGDCLDPDVSSIDESKVSDSDDKISPKKGESK